MGAPETAGLGALSPGIDPGQKWTTERVLSIHHWSPSYLTIRTTRYRGFRFRPGHYTRLGLGEADSIVWRPYSVASADYDDHLDFVAVRVPEGEFSDHLARLQPGDPIRVDKLSYGFLTVDQLAPGKSLWLLASGTGLGPFVSILRDPAVWRDFERLVVVHSVRHAAELVWREEISGMPQGELFADAKARLIYVPIVTREPGATTLSARMTDLIANGHLEAAAGCALDAGDARVLVCGNPDLTQTLRKALSARGFVTNRRGVPGQMAFEKYW